MEAAIALLLPLIGGNLFVRGYNGIRYKAAREDGHRFYFRVAYHGVLLFVFSAVVVMLLDRLLSGQAWFIWIRDVFTDRIPGLLKEPGNAASHLGFLMACTLSVALGRLTPVLLNLALTVRNEQALWEAAAENELEEFLLDALAQVKSIAVTLTTGKVYVGNVLTTPEPRTERKVIALLPLMSGFRDDDGGKVVFTTFYDQFYPDGDVHASDDFRLILPVDKMASLSFFDVQVYARFNAELQLPRKLSLWPGLRDKYLSQGRAA